MTQLGLGTCHCLHENVWLQAVGSVLGFAEGGGPDRMAQYCDESRSTGHSGHDDDCDCEGEITVIGTKDTKASLSNRSASLDTPIVASWCPRRGVAWRTSICYAADPIPGVAVRAELGVFLL